MSLAFVVQRFGADVAGGAEALCRQTAHALAARGEDVTVYTTTARDYLGWEPHFPAGESDDEGVRVLRFDPRPADPGHVGDLLRVLSAGRGDDAMEREWALAQGPVSPDLLAALRRDAPRHGAVALWTYLYATTQLAMPMVADRSVLVPLAHDEPMFRFGLTRGLVRMAAALAFLTPEERRLVDDLHGLGDTPSAVVGAGLSAAPRGAAPRARAERELPARFALYVGRVDAAKGIDELVRAHAVHRAAGGPLGLVLAGRAAGRLRLPEWVVRTDFVDAAARADLLAACEVALLPSRHESLSLSALEAWQAGRPTLANAASEVLAGQSARSGGGLLYDGRTSYARQLARLGADPRLRAVLGDAGRRFTAEWTWDAAVDRWRELLARVGSVPTRQPESNSKR